MNFGGTIPVILKLGTTYIERGNSMPLYPEERAIITNFVGGWENQFWGGYFGWGWGGDALVGRLNSITRSASK